MMNCNEPENRRRSYRVNVADATARCACSETVGHYVVRDLSMGGALLADGPRLPVGTRMELLLVLPGRGTVLVEGRVLRVFGAENDELPHHSNDGRSSNRLGVAVQFASLSAQDEDFIEDTVVMEYVREHDPVALVASDDEDGTLVGMLAAAGLTAMRVRTPLEVIHHLERPGHRVHTVVLGAHLGAVDGLEFASFLWDAYPHVRRVFAPAGRPGAGDRAPGLVHAVLPTPWTARLVRHVLGAAPPLQARA